MSLIIPAPQALSRTDAEALCADVLAWADTTDDVAALDDARRRMAAIEEYVQGTSAEGPVESANRLLEARVGWALGPAEHHKDGPVSRDLPLEKWERHDFRALFASKATWEPLLPLSRRVALRVGKNGQGHLAPLMTSVHPEWYTPPEIIAAVVATLGAIDLDPCSNSKETPNVPAKMHLTAEDDGLSVPWKGRVYMNPPYGRAIEDWTRKLAVEWAEGRVTEAVALLPARTDTSWWQSFPCEVGCLIAGRLTFSGYQSAAPFPSAALYLNRRTVVPFTNAFAPLGRIFRYLS